MEKALERVHYREKLKEFTKSDEARNDLLLGILTENEELKDKLLERQRAHNIELEELRREHDNEKYARRMWQDQVAELKTTLRSATSISDAGHAIAVILDGDGALFNDNLYAKGRDGGAEAAFQVRTYIREKLRAQFPDMNTYSWQLNVSLVLSLQGLAKKLLACNIISRLDQLTDFGHGWVSQPLFTFTDVGSGKERADHKIREILHANVTASYCKQVYFGPCSDNGYLTTLESLKPDPNLAMKITLIETRPAEPGFIRLNFERIGIPAVFRSTNLPERPLGKNGGSSNIEFIRPSPRPAIAVVSSAPAVAPPASATDSTSSDQETTSWITVGKNLVKGGGNLNSKNKPQSKAYILLNSKDERVDPDLEEPGTAAERRFKYLTEDQKMCNDYHLRGVCPVGEKKCPHMHGERLSADMLLVLRAKARGLPCGSGSRCRDFDCTFGHHCRFKEGCSYDVCWFKDNHKMDFVPVKKLYEGCVLPVFL
ncbi:hypothetical protein AMS68_000991 [Peltaster fructicola]|uniref:C3H1-type domain-containing protein n=1 Tax=Peltaster fructicola TaxID=286661 RepID=A0A6H0XL68_9PEZI|nr:hypothetical protein AMS68_000991 [Peltaster fructicola]